MSGIVLPDPQQADELTTVDALPTRGRLSSQEKTSLTVTSFEERTILQIQPSAHRDLVGSTFGEASQILLGLDDITLGDAQEKSREEGTHLSDILLKEKLIKPEDVNVVTAAQLDLPYIDQIDDEAILDHVMEPMSITFAKTHKILPLGYTEDELLVLATSEPLSTDAHDEVCMMYSSELSIVVTSAEELFRATNAVFDRVQMLAESAVASLEDGEGTAIDSGAEDEIKDLLDSDPNDEAPIIRLVNSLLSQAAKEGASDIHIEPFEREMLVRFRVDGVLKEIVKPPRRFKDAITSRIKIIADLNIAEKRLPQDGRIRLKVAGKDIDIRVSTVPTTYGERIVMRLLDRSSVLRDLDTIGFSQENLKTMMELIHKSYGFILVTGPTGSGKTTTLYGSLAKINKPGLNILTIEDPVEYQLKGVGQVQVNSKIDLTFASGLRAFLRQDPDVVMVGEIRDRETAEIAIQASLTGHLVLSTVHTNDAPGAVTRLVDMGIEPFLVASSVIGILAQRLVRTICEDCKESYQATEAELTELGLERHEVPQLWRGAGCKSCGNTGYRGRLGIYELMTIDDDVKALILENVDSGRLKRLAREKGMKTLREDGIKKVLAGRTTVAELSRVTQEDSAAGSDSTADGLEAIGGAI